MKTLIPLITLIFALSVSAVSQSDHNPSGQKVIKDQSLLTDQALVKAIATLVKPLSSPTIAASIDPCGECVANGWQQCGINGGGIEVVIACQDRVLVDCATQGK